jgi:hypothetical protein
MKRIIIKIDCSGNVQIEAKGFSGSACLESTKAIENAIGQTTNRTRKSSFYKVENLYQVERQNC